MTNLFLYVSIFLAALAGMIVGFDTGVISGAIIFIQKEFEITPFFSGLLVASVSFGAIFGALINGFFVDKIGRKNTLILSGLVFLFGSLFCSISQNIYQLTFFRAFLGIAVGVVSFVAPLYLGEISDKEIRGRAVSFYQIALTFGILFSYLINYLCATMHYQWRIMFFVGVIPAILLSFGMLFAQDTPRWYVLKNNIKKAQEVLLKFGSKNPKEELLQIQNTLNLNNKIKFDKKLITPFLIGIGIMVFQVATGINAIIYYAPTIFKSLGFLTDNNILFVTIFIGLINFLMTFVAFVVVDKLGRKPLLYIGLSGMIISLFVLSIAFLFQNILVGWFAIVACAIYIISFSMSFGPVAFLIISEVFPLKYRAWAMSVAILSNFICNFIVSALFPCVLNKIGGTYTFTIFVVICIFAFLFVYFVVPETKNLTLEEIEAKWK